MARKPKRKRRTSIRTAAGVAQEKFLERVRQLAADPHRVLPECPDGEPKAIAKLHAGLDKVAAGKIGFFDKRDKGVLGAVIQSASLAGLQTVPRLLDTKIAGKRRFFLQRGHVTRSAMLGVQNHDEPRALLMAYRDMAKSEGLHFFAGPRLWCTGTEPQPPGEWLEALAKEAEAPLHAKGSDWAIGRDDRARVRLTFHGGPSVDVAPGPTHMHKALAARYAGPRRRHPVGVQVVLPDGTVEEPEREALASYRAGVIDERRLVDQCVAAWRSRQDVAGARRFVLGARDLGDHDAFVAALSPEPWEEPALRAVTADGFVGDAKSSSDVFRARKDRMAEAVRAVLPDAKAARRLIRDHGNMQVRDLVRKAHETAEAMRLDQTLPAIAGGPEIEFIDAVARGRLRGGKATSLQVVHRALDAGKVPAGHVAAFLEAVGGDIATTPRIAQDAAETGAHLKEAAAAVLEAQGEAYPKAVDAFLRLAGSSERLT